MDDDGNGRVGGLLSPVPGFACEVEEMLDLEAVLDVVAGLRLTIIDNRFGGIPFLGAKFCAVCRGLPCCREVSLDLDGVADLSSLSGGGLVLSAGV